MADIVQLPDAKSRPKRRMKPTPIPRRYARKMKAEAVAALHRTNADFEAVFPPAGEKIVFSRQKISKIDTVIALLRRPDGASLDEIVAALGTAVSKCPPGVSVCPGSMQCKYGRQQTRELGREISVLLKENGPYPFKVKTGVSGCSFGCGLGRGRSSRIGGRCASEHRQHDCHSQ